MRGPEPACAGGLAQLVAHLLRCGGDTRPDGGVVT